MPWKRASHSSWRTPGRTRFSRRDTSELEVIAYAGIPLITSDGYALGTLCIVDQQPRDWTEEEVGILRVLATSAMSEIELRRLVGDSAA